MVAVLVTPVSLTSAPRAATRSLRAGVAPARAARAVSVRASAEERQVRRSIAPALSSEAISPTRAHHPVFVVRRPPSLTLTQSTSFLSNDFVRIRNRSRPLRPAARWRSRLSPR